MQFRAAFLHPLSPVSGILKQVRASAGDMRNSPVATSSAIGGTLSEGGIRLLMSRRGTAPIMGRIAMYPERDLSEQLRVNTTTPCSPPGKATR